MAALCEPVEIYRADIEVDDFLRVDDDAERRWCVIHTKSRREKKIVERCAITGIKSYLPLRESVTVSRSRRHVAAVPMFPGYAFACLRYDERPEMYRTGHVANVIDVVDQDGLLQDLRRIKMVADRRVCLTPEPAVKRGSRVRIIDGPLTGLEGVVRVRKGRTRLALTVDCIRQAVACEVDISTIVPI